MVRPWKAPSVATTWVRPVLRVSLNAASLASAPELAKKTLPGDPSSDEEALGEAHLRLGGEEVRDVAQGLHLVGDRLDQRRVGVAEGVHGDAAEEVEVLLAVVVPHGRALAPGEHQLGRPEGVHQRLGVARLEVGHFESFFSPGA